jgi:hypothetical protein
MILLTPIHCKEDLFRKIFSQTQKQDDEWKANRVGSPSNWYWMSNDDTSYFSETATSGAREALPSKIENVLPETRKRSSGYNAPEGSGMAFCPQCGAEYRKPLAECSHCHIPLVDRPPEAGISPEPDEQADEVDLDILIRTGLDHPISIALAESLLREAGIPFFVMDQNVAARQESGNALGWWSVRVGRDRESEAREILESVENMK